VVILAAGQGHRLLERSQGVPKPLVPVLGLSLLERTVRACREAGITQGYVVVGYRQEQMQAPLALYARRYGMDLQAVSHPQWLEGNGTSALAVAPYVLGPFFLVMCDHVFDPDILRALQRADDGSAVCRLGVDHRIDTVFDLDDATKVKLQGTAITAIGKDLSRFDAIDTGLFLCRPMVFEALVQARAAGDGSLSGGMRRLIAAGTLQAVDTGSRMWSDVDTPASLVYTEQLLLARQPTVSALPHT
jgi:choline kinase